MPWPLLPYRHSACIQESGTITLDEFVSGKARNLAKHSQIAYLMPRNELMILAARAFILVLTFDQLNHSFLGSLLSAGKVVRGLEGDLLEIFPEICP